MLVTTKQWAEFGMLNRVLIHHGNMTDVVRIAVFFVVFFQSRRKIKEEEIILMIITVGKIFRSSISLILAH